MALQLPKSEGEALRLLQSLGGRCAEKALVFAALPLEMKTSAMHEELRRDCRMKPVSKLKVTSYGHDMLTLVPPDMLVDDSITSKSSFVRHRGAPSHSRYYRDIPENSVALEDHMNRPTPEKDFLNHDLVERTRTYGLTEEGRLKVLRLAFDELFPDLELEGLCFDRPEGWGSRYSKIFARLYDRNLDPDDFDVHADRLAAVFGPEAITYDDRGPRLAAQFMGVPTDVLVRFDLWMGKRSPLGRILTGDLRPVPERPWVNPTEATSLRKPSSPTGNNIIPFPKGRGQKARDKGLSDVDKARLKKLRTNLKKMIGSPVIPPGFIDKVRAEIRAITMKLKECRAVSGDGAAQGAGGDAVTLKKGDLIRVDLGWEGVATFRVDHAPRVNCHPRAHYPDRPYVHATRVSRPRHSSYTLSRSFYVDEVQLIRSC